jgi:hypothetical protein
MVSGSGYVLGVQRQMTQTSTLGDQSGGISGRNKEVEERIAISKMTV